MGIPADRLPDETLLAGFGTGDADLSLAFVRRFQRVVFGVALTVIGDPATAEDIAQQTFERAWRQRLAAWATRNTEFFARSAEPLSGPG